MIILRQELHLVNILYFERGAEFESSRVREFERERERDGKSAIDCGDAATTNGEPLLSL